MLRLMLDSGPLSELARKPPPADLLAWSARMIAAGVQLLVPEIIDYEVRRELVRGRKTAGVRRLDGLAVRFLYVPLTTEVMKRAAEIWAEARQDGGPTADDAGLDVDVILAAQAESEGAVVVTSNVRHLARFVPAAAWADVALPSD